MIAAKLLSLGLRRIPRSGKAVYRSTLDQIR
jgi:hypothetical protein